MFEQSKYHLVYSIWFLLDMCDFSQPGTKYKETSYKNTIMLYRPMQLVALEDFLVNRNYLPRVEVIELFYNYYYFY